MSFSVLTVTRRQGWEEIARRSIEHQTVKPDNWIIVSETDPMKDLHVSELWKASKDEFQITLLKSPDKKPGMKSNLNASLNEGLRNIHSDYVIFYQDFIDLQPDCFEQLIEFASPITFVTTIDRNPDGSMGPRYEGIDEDWPCQPEQWEANVSIAPMGILRELGGFDEEYDRGWSWDNVNIAERAALLDCDFILDEKNIIQLHEHDQSPIKQLNGDFHVQRMEQINNGDFPLRLDYI